MKITRRKFLKKAAGRCSAALCMPYVIASTALGSGSIPAASERITVGHIGVGGQGKGLLGNFISLKDSQTVAICDPFQQRRESVARYVDEKYAGRFSKEQYHGCHCYRDFREVIAREDLDAIVIATPDHWHVPIATAAVRAGKDVYVEKPLGLSIDQDKALRAEVIRLGRVFQYGTQQRSFNPHCALGCQFVRNGILGKLIEIRVQAPAGESGGSTKPIPVPDDLDYDLWLGPAMLAPYTQDRCTSRGSYFVYDNSIGFLGGWGAHPLDLMHWAYPYIPVEYEGSGVIPATGLFNTVTRWDVRGRFEEGVRFIFTDGEKDKTTFIGEKGRLSVSRQAIDANPADLLKITLPADAILPEQGDHHQQNFIDAVKTRKTPVSDIFSAVQSDFISHLSDIAIRTGGKIRWNPQKEEIVDNPAADRMCGRPMRSPWRL
jgi:glucose-fructose oxidoreductase